MTATTGSVGSRPPRNGGWTGYDVGLWLVIALASALRAWLALTDHSIYWPDEIYQSLEQAHRVAFGNGIVPWEFRDGARSWLLPGAIAGVWKLAALLGVKSSLALVGIARLGMVLASASALWLSAKVTERLSNARAGLVAAIVLAVLPASVVFGYRTLSETVSAPLVVLGIYFLLERSQRGAGWAGAAITVATLLRYQNGLFAVAFLLWLLAERRRREAYAFCSAALGCGIAGGLLDWVTWGRPFNSLVTYVEFNLLEGGASSFGVEPIWYYAKSLWDSTGPALLVFAGLAAVGALTVPAFGLFTGAYLLAHSLIPHKELRFIVPCFPIAAVLAGLGAARAYGLSRTRHGLWWLGLGASACAATFSLTQLTYGRMGQYLDTPRSARRIWNTDEDANLLLAQAGRQPDLCGIAALGLRSAFTGGYTYLHRAVPLVYGSGLCDAQASVNYLLVPRTRASLLLPAGYAAVSESGDLGLFRRSGSCAPLPASYDELLEGAYNMGLQRATSPQAPDGSFHFDLLKHSGAFISGWGNGEIVDCKPARWAVGLRSVLRFRAQQTGMLFAIRAHLQGYEATPAQRMRLSFNEQLLFDGDVPAGPLALRRDLPPQTLRNGDNELVFEFARTLHPGGDDPRELAVLLQGLEIVPLTDDYVIDLGAPSDAEHLVAGFSSNENEGDSTYVWSDGPFSELTGTLVNPQGPHLLTLRGQAIPWTASQHTRVMINDHPVGSVDFTPEWSQQILRVSPEHLRPGANRIRFDYEKTVAPASLSPESTDDRQLAVRFDSLRLEPLPSRSVIDLGSPEARPFLLDGWSGDEQAGHRTAVWSAGPRARMMLSLSGEHPAQAISVEAHAYQPALPLEVTVYVNDQATGSFSPTKDWHTYEVPLKPESFSKSGDILEFRFDHTARPSQQEPASNDTRDLALRVDQVRIVR